MEVGNGIAVRVLAPVFHRHPRYLLDEFIADASTGHNVRATTFVDAHAMYRRDGPDKMKSVDKFEFVNGVAASGLYGEIQACAGIVGGIDLTLGNDVEPLLAAHIQAGGGRHRGVRSPVVFGPDQLLRPLLRFNSLLNGNPTSRPASKPSGRSLYV